MNFGNEHCSCAIIPAAPATTAMAPCNRLCSRGLSCCSHKKSRSNTSSCSPLRSYTPAKPSALLGMFGVRSILKTQKLSCCLPSLHHGSLRSIHCRAASCSIIAMIFNAAFLSCPCPEAQQGPAAVQLPLGSLFSTEP